MSYQLKGQIVDRIASVVLTQVISKHYSKGNCKQKTMRCTINLYNSIECSKRSHNQKLLMTGAGGIWGTG